MIIPMERDSEKIYVKTGFSFVVFFLGWIGIILKRDYRFYLGKLLLYNIIVGFIGALLFDSGKIMCLLCNFVIAKNINKLLYRDLIKNGYTLSKSSCEDLLISVSYVQEYLNVLGWNENISNEDEDEDRFPFLACILGVLSIIIITIIITIFAIN